MPTSAIPLRLAALCFCVILGGVATTDVAVATTDPSRTIVDSVYDPVSPGNTTTLYGGTWGTHNQVTVTCYHPSAPELICAGGGDFDKGSCTSVSNNFVTVVKDGQGTGSCWFRKNFGLNGFVDARQCGVYGDGIHDDGATLNTCLAIAGQRSRAIPRSKMRYMS
jgi:hypothetical protein